MSTKDFAKCFFGRRDFNSDEREKLREEWSKMTNKEKIELIDSLSNMNENNFFSAGFGCQAHFAEKWKTMSDKEKELLIEEWGKIHEMHQHKKHFSVEDMDAKCEEWMKKTPEEKAEFVKKREDNFHSRISNMRSHFGRFGFENMH